MYVLVGVLIKSLYMFRVSTRVDCILLHLVGFLLILNYDARNHELKKLDFLKIDCIVSLMTGCYCLLYAPDSKHFDHTI